MASPAFGAIGTLTNISASTSVPRPSVSTGDLMILAVVGAYGDATITPPSGWTALANIDQGSAFEHELRLYWKIAGAGEASTYTVAIGGQGGGNNYGYGVIWTYTGADATTPVPVSATQRNTSSSTSATCPSVTTTAADQTLVCIYVSGNNSVSNTWTPPSGMTERLDAGANPTGFVVGIADLAVASAGATGTKTATSSLSGTSNAISFAIASYVAPDTTAPTITGPGGATGSTSSISVAENTTAIHTFTADEAVTWSLNGGADVALFSINSSTGALSFISGRDFETPTDADANNTYIVGVRATDGSSNATTQTVTVTVTDVAEGGASKAARHYYQRGPRNA